MIFAHFKLFSVEMKPFTLQKPSKTLFFPQKQPKSSGFRYKYRYFSVFFSGNEGYYLEKTTKTAIFTPIYLKTPDFL